MRKDRFRGVLEAAIIVAGAFAVAIVLHSMSHVLRTSREGRAVARTIEALKENVGVAHLAFEHALASGDSQALVRHVYAQIDRSIAAADRLLERSEGLLADARARTSLAALTDRLRAWRDLAVRRWERQAGARPLTDEDRAYNLAFHEVLDVLARNEVTIDGVLDETYGAQFWQNAGTFLLLLGLFLGIAGLVRRALRAAEAEARRLEETVRERTADLERKSDAVEAIAAAMGTYLGSGDFRRAVAVLLRGALRSTGSEHGLVGIVADGPRLRVAAHEGLVREAGEKYAAAVGEYGDVGFLEFPSLENPFGRVVAGRAAILSNDAVADARLGAFPAGHPPVRSFLGVPLLVGGERVGVVAVANRPGGYGERERADLEVLASACGVLYDGCRRIEREASLERQLQRSHKMEEIGRLAAGVAHEINNPLTYVLHNLDGLETEVRLLAEGPAEPAAVEDLARRVREAAEGAERVRVIVRDLKTFARMDSEERAPVRLDEVVEKAVRTAASEIRYRASLVREIGPVPPVLAHEGRLTQVLLNLLVNAAQAIPEGQPERNRITVRTSTEGDEAVVEVRDTGVGIPPENLDQIFEPFFTTKPSEEGTGLGLSVCRNIVASYGGRIEVQSTPHLGSVFRVRLPAAREWPAAAPTSAAVAAPPPPPPAAAVAGPRRRVLVVDDEPAVRSLLARLLAREHDVETAGGGREAMALLGGGGRYDVVLCDLMMPEVSGMDLHDWLAARDPSAAGRMVFMAGGVFTPAARTFLDRVPNRRVEKPFRREEILGIVREAAAASAA